MFNLDLTEVVITVIQLIFALGVAYLGKLAHNKQKNDKVMELIKIAVGAAEQLYKSGVIRDRKAYVLQKLTENGINIDGAKIDLAIESEVNKLGTIVDRLPKETVDGAGIGYDR